MEFISYRKRHFRSDDGVVMRTADRERKTAADGGKARTIHADCTSYFFCYSKLVFGRLSSRATLANESNKSFSFIFLFTRFNSRFYRAPTDSFRKFTPNKQPHSPLPRAYVCVLVERRGETAVNGRK